MYMSYSTDKLITFLFRAHCTIKISSPWNEINKKCVIYTQHTWTCRYISTCDKLFNKCNMHDHTNKACSRLQSIVFIQKRMVLYIVYPGRRLNWSWRSKKTTHILFWKSLDVESKRILVHVLRFSYEAST